MVIPSDESAVISEPIKIFFTVFLIPTLCDGVILPILGLMFIVLKRKKYREISFLTTVDVSSFGSISIVATSDSSFLLVL